MIKKALLILAYPFILLYLVISFPFKIAYIIFKDKKENPTKKKKEKIVDDVNFLYVGQLLFANYKNEFTEFYNLYLTDKKQLNTKYKLNLKDNNADFNPIEILQIFGDLKQKIGVIDWKGEENINEIEDLIKSQIDKEIVWTNTISLRNSIEESKQNDGKFIIKLFQEIDKDLQRINYRLLFFEMGGDAYVYIPTKTNTFDRVLENAPNDFQSADEL